MRWLAEAGERVRCLLFRNREEAEMREEMRFHLDMEAERIMREEGVGAREARRRAAVAFGGVERHKEEVRDARGLAWVGGLALDLRLAFRMLVKYPGLTIVGGIGMAVAIAISTASFAFFHSHLYPTLPLDEGDRIVALENWDAERNNEERRSLHDLATWREEMRTVREIGAFRTIQRNLAVRGGPPEPLAVAEMTASGFRVARVAPLLGRPLLDEDELPGAQPVVVLGHDVWRTRFAADSAVVGNQVRLGETLRTVVGVMPEGFSFPVDHGLWTPLRTDPAGYERRRGPAVHAFGRLAPGATAEEAQAELAAIGRRTAADFPATHAHLRPRVLPYTYPIADIQDVSLWEVGLMQLMVSLLLVIVAVNVAVLVYARTATRLGEIAVRSALGATRRRIVGQLFVEALVLAGAAAAVGLVIARFGLRQANLIMEQETDGAPFWVDYGLSSATVLYVMGLTLLAAVIVGVLPAVQTTGRRLESSLRQLGGGTGMRLGRTWTALVVMQVAIAVAALPAAAGMGWSEIRIAAIRPAFPAEEFLGARLVMDVEAAPEVDREARRQEILARYGAHLTEVLRRLREDPAVAGATFASDLPGSEIGATVEVEDAATGSGGAAHRVRSARVDLAYFDVLGGRLLAGRPFGAADTDSAATAVVVNGSFVREVLGGGSALGRRVRLREPADDDAPGAAPPAPRWFEIVGVVADLHRNAVAPAAGEPVMYRAAAPERAYGAFLAVHLRGGRPGDFAPRLRELAAAQDPMLRLTAPRSLADMDRQAQVAVRLIAVVLALVTVSVLLLSAAGIYALMSFTVTRRRKEIGIRSALGADPRRILRGIFSRAAGQIALGLAVGLGAALLLERLSGGELMGGLAPVLLPGVAALMMGAGLLAALGPARRGLRVQPMEALREE